MGGERCSWKKKKKINKVDDRREEEGEGDLNR